MPFVPKNWQDTPSTATPISALALEDMEVRLAAYADSIRGAIYTLPSEPAPDPGDYSDGQIWIEVLE